MTAPAARYAFWSGLVALGVGVALLLVAGPFGPDAVRWTLLGWSVMAVTGVAGGSWLARVHGRPGAGFLVALGTCMLARLFAAAAGAGAAAWIGMSAAWPFVGGLVAGFLPMQAFEITWFLRRTKLEAR